MSTRLGVKKTYKLYIGGKFPRSESGRYLPAKSAAGEHLDNFAHASRKDFRDAVVAARVGVGGGGEAAPLVNPRKIFFPPPRSPQTPGGDTPKKRPPPPGGGGGR